MTIEQTPQGPQLTIRGLVAALDGLPGGVLIKMAGFGNGIAPVELRRRRAHGEGVTILGRYERMSWMTVNRFKVMLIEHAVQPVTMFNPNPTTMDAPLWAGRTSDHRLEFQAVTGVEVIQGAAYLRWVDVAPVQGPSLHRISDEEVLRRNADLAGRDDASLDPSSNGNRWMLQQIPQERDRTRVRLAETQDAIAALLREAGGLESELVRYDYVLGLTDVKPPRP